MNRRLLAVIRLWATYSVAMLVLLWPDLPSSPVRWARLLLVGAPLCVLVTLGAHWVLSRLRESPRVWLSRVLSFVVLAVCTVILFVIVMWTLPRPG